MPAGPLSVVQEWVYRYLPIAARGAAGDAGQTDISTRALHDFHRLSRWRAAL